MRELQILVMALALAACASGGAEPEETPSAFPVERGTAPAPPHTHGGRAAPPEGVGPGGLDFGQWRGADPARYGPAFQERVRARHAGRGIAEIRADLEANGFSCTEGARLECRIEIMEQECGIDWYVVVERAGAPPVAGFDVMCLGAR